MSIEKKPAQTTSIDNTIISNSIIAIGNNNQTKMVKTAGPEKTLTSQEVLTIIQEMQSLLQGSGLKDDKKSECSRHLQIVKEEVKRENPNKEYAAQTLQKIAHLLRETRDSTNSGDNVMDKVQPVITRMLPWLGETKKFHVI